MVWLWQNSKRGWHILGSIIRNKSLPPGMETLVLTGTKLEQGGF